MDKAEKTIDERAYDLASAVIDDPCIVMGGCSFNRFSERIAQALRDERKRALEEAAKSVQDIALGNEFCDINYEEDNFDAGAQRGLKYAEIAIRALAERTEG